MNYYESLLRALSNRDNNITLCQDDYEALQAYLASKRKPEVQANVCRECGPTAVPVYLGYCNQHSPKE